MAGFLPSSVFLITSFLLLNMVYYRNVYVKINKKNVYKLFVLLYIK